MTRPSILSSTVPMKPMTGRTRRSGRKPILLLVSQSVSIKSKLPVNLPNRIPVRRIPLGSSGSINGSSRLSAGCQWRNGMPAPSRSMKNPWRAVSAMVVWTYLPQRILQPSCWYFLRWMRMISSVFFHTFGYRKIRWSFESDETMSLTMSGNDKAFWRPPKEMSSTTVTSRNSSSDLENASTLER